MKFTKSKMRQFVTLIGLLMLPLWANSQRIQPSSVSCQDTVRATARAWFAQKSRADTLSKALTDTTVRFRQYRKTAMVRQDSTYRVGFSKGKKEGKAYGRKQVLGIEAVVIIVIGFFKFLVFK